MRKVILVSLVLLASRSSLATEGVEWGGYVDSYLALDTQPSATRDRPFTTQAVRNNEFNVNLAFLEARLAQAKTRGRVALQVGTSVQSNYAGEPTIGANSGPSLVRHIQEGYAGIQVAPDLWVDAGIFFSHIGFESWISADNWTYTRSLVADYSPYYQAGVRAGWRANDRWSLQLLVLNGWQIISENNDSKALGTQIAFAPNAIWSVTYATFLGNENGFRHFHDWILKFTPGETYQTAFQFDLGHQDRKDLPAATWGGFTWIHRFRLRERLHLAARAERYWDPDGVVAVSNTGIGLRAWGGSLGLDLGIGQAALLRTEFRSLWAQDPVFPGRSEYHDTNSVWTTSLALRF